MIVKEANCAHWLHQFIKLYRRNNLLVQSAFVLCLLPFVLKSGMCGRRRNPNKHMLRAGLCVCVLLRRVQSRRKAKLPSELSTLRLCQC